MMTPDEIAEEKWLSEMQESISAEAIDGFTSGRLSSYYRKHPSLAENVFEIYREAKSVAEKSPTAALLLFTAAIEVALKSAVLKPVIYGLVHNESVADLVSDLVVKNNGLDRFKEVLSAIMSKYGMVDFENYKISGHTKNIWEEITAVQKARNSVAHRAEPATPETAVLAQEIATAIIVDFLQGVLNTLGLELERSGKIV
ncbi:hypothetical protein ACFOKJ_04065 [Vogesella amnigena]|uniref:RiboL-PSP-HEPN domain-containing protein n=1 Tax=Vogesella amnigena TaxID=1507449 RepID=A0ABV7TRF1_9NEIS